LGVITPPHGEKHVGVGGRRIVFGCPREPSGRERQMARAKCLTNPGLVAVCGDARRVSPNPTQDTFLLPFFWCAGGWIGGVWKRSCFHLDLRADSPDDGCDGKQSYHGRRHRPSLGFPSRFSRGKPFHPLPPWYLAFLKGQCVCTSRGGIRLQAGQIKFGGDIAPRSRAFWRRRDEVGAGCHPLSSRYFSGTHYSVCRGAAYQTWRGCC